MARGSKPVEGEVRSEVLKVRHTPTFGRSMDAVRNHDEPRSEFARNAIRNEIRARGGQA